MTTQEIANFIKAQLQLGSAKAEIEKILSLNRVTPQEISAAFDLAASGGGEVPLRPVASAPASTPAPIQPPTPATKQEFPPPAMAMSSIDSVTPAYNPPIRSSSPQNSTAPSPIMPPPPINVAARPPVIPTIPQAPKTPNRGGGGFGQWLLFFFVLIILGLGGTSAYAYLMRPAWAEPILTPILNLIQPPVTPPVTIEEPIAPPAPVDPTADWQTYKSEKYGFEIKFPPDWVDYKVVENKKWDLATTTLTFGALDQDYLFEVHIFTKTKWNEYESNSNPLKSTKYITENNNYVFGFAHAQDHTASTTPLVQEFSEIISTFKFIEPAATSTPVKPTSTSTQASSGALPPAVDLPSLFLPQN